MADAVIDIRPLVPADREAVLGLADRLTIGVAEWRSRERVLAAVRAWVCDAVEHCGTRDGRCDRALFVAADDATVVGFVSVSEDVHWSGDTDAYIGELVVAPDREKQGIGSELVAAAEVWAASRGLARIRLATGAANIGALSLYAELGYRHEDVTLSKPVSGREGPER